MEFELYITRNILIQPERLSVLFHKWLIIHRKIPVTTCLKVRETETSVSQIWLTMELSWLCKINYRTPTNTHIYIREHIQQSEFCVIHCNRRLNKYHYSLMGSVTGVLSLISYSHIRAWLPWQVQHWICCIILYMVKFTVRTQFHKNLI